jgi:hypothetical protein
MSHPPRAVESLLKSLGADPYLSDVILGDLVEEFDQRLAFDGEADARRWYTTEAIRAVPHLLRNALKQLRFGDVPRLIGVALFSWLALLPISLSVWVVVATIARLLGVSWPTLQISVSHPAFLAFVMLTMPLAGGLGGYIAAWRNARAPLIGAAAFGVVLTSINLIAGLFGPSPLPVAYRIAALSIFNVAALIGGALRVIRLKPSAGSLLSTP